jgi:peroxiredoxin
MPCIVNPFLKPWQAVRVYHIVDALKPRTIFSPKEQSMKIVLTIALAGLFCLDVVPGNTSASEDDPPSIGEKAPSFTLKDQNGKERSLDELLKKGKVALVFYRSAGWWPFCQKQLVQLQSDLKDLEAAGLTIVGISYDAVDVLAKFAEKRKITFPLLSDPGSKTITAYGLLNKDAKGKTQGIPYPATIVLDGKGTIRAKLAMEGYRDRHTTKDLIKAAKDISQ